MKIRVETIAHYLQRYAGEIIRKKKGHHGEAFPVVQKVSEG